MTYNLMEGGVTVRLKELRTANKITQDKLSKILGVSRTTVTMWESGASEPDTDTLIRLAEILNVSVDTLLGNTKKPPTSEDVSGLTPKQLKIIEMMDQMTPEQQTELVRQAEYQLWMRKQKKDNP